MPTSRSIPAVSRMHNRCRAPKRTSVSASTPEIARASASQVLHCLPLPGSRGRSLQFEPFDQSYLERLKAGDFRTQEHFGAYFSALIQIKLRSRLKSPEAIEDVRQDTFTRFFAALNDGRILHPERLGSYVNSMCNNVMFEHYRYGSRLDSLDDDKQRDLPAKGTDLLGLLTAKETQQRVRKVLEELPERDRRLLRELFYEERDKDEICRDFGVDREYLRVVLYRAKRSFKALYLKDMGDDEPELSSV